MQSQQDLLYSYIVNTKFYDHLRSRLDGNLSGQELKELVYGIESVCRYKNGILNCTFDQPVYMILVYGEIGYQGKCFKKGDYVKLEKVYTDVEVNFVKATTLLLINYEVLEFRIEQIVTIRHKMGLIQKSMPVQQLKLTLSEIRKIAKNLQIREIHEKYREIPKEHGIFLFFQGIFQLCSEGIPVLELQNNFIQISQSLLFTIRLKLSSGTYGFITKEAFQTLVSQQTMAELSKINKARQLLKNMNKNKKQYLDAAEALRKKIQKKLKIIKKLGNETDRSNYDSSMKQSLQNSRRTMLQKCSTAVTTLKSFSLGQSRRTDASPQKFKTMYLIATPIKQKEEIKYAKTEQRLKKMRYFTYSKQKTKLQKDWYYLDDDKMNQTLSMTYFKIKSSQKNQQQIKAMQNYKRVHRIYSDPCFKKGITFRNY